MPAQRRPLLKNPAELVTVVVAGLILVATVVTGTGIIGNGGSDDVTHTSRTTATSPAVPSGDQYVSGRSSARGSLDPWTSGNGSRRTSPQSTGPTTGSPEDFVDVLSPWLSKTQPPPRGSRSGVIPAPMDTGTATPGPGAPAAAPTSPAGPAPAGGSTAATPPPGTGTPTPSDSETSSPSTPPTATPTPTTPATSPTSADAPSSSPTPSDTPSGTTSTGASPSSGTSGAQTDSTGGAQSGSTTTSNASDAPVAQTD